MKEFLSKFEKIDKKDDLKKFMNIEFDDAKIPYPGKEKGFVHIGPEIKKITQTPSLEALYEVLKNIPCSLKCKDGITIKEYPLVKIEEIKNCKINKNGLYELNINQEYKITLSYYQGEDHRDRTISINDDKFIGKSETKSIIIEETKQKEDKINKIVIKFNKLEFIVPLHVNVKIPYLKKKFVPLLIILVLCLVMFYLYNTYVLESEYKEQISIIMPFSIIILKTLLEEIYK